MGSAGNSKMTFADCFAEQMPDAASRCKEVSSAKIASTVSLPDAEGDIPLKNLPSTKNAAKNALPSGNLISTLSVPVNMTPVTIANIVPALTGDADIITSGDDQTGESSTTSAQVVPSLSMSAASAAGQGVISATLGVPGSSDASSSKSSATRNESESVAARDEEMEPTSANAIPVENIAPATNTSTPIDVPSEINSAKAPNGPRSTSGKNTSDRISSASKQFNQASGDDPPTAEPRSQGVNLATIMTPSEIKGMAQANGDGASNQANSSMIAPSSSIVPDGGHKIMTPIQMSAGQGPKANGLLYSSSSQSVDPGIEIADPQIAGGASTDAAGLAAATSEMNVGLTPEDVGASGEQPQIEIPSKTRVALSNGSAAAQGSPNNIPARNVVPKEGNDAQRVTSNQTTVAQGAAPGKGSSGSGTSSNTSEHRSATLSATDVSVATAAGGVLVAAVMPAATSATGQGTGVPTPAPGSNSTTPTPSGSAQIPHGAPTEQPVLNISASPVQLAQMVSKAGQAEMRIGMNTSAFGSIEVRTVVHANDVGVLIGSEKGDLRSLLAPEIPGIASTLQRQDLRLNQVNFQQSFTSSGGSSSGADSQPRAFAEKSHPAATLRTEDAGPERTEAPEGRILDGKQSLSILA